MKRLYFFSFLTLLFLTNSNLLQSQATRFWSGGSNFSDNIDQGLNWFDGIIPNAGDNLHFNNTCGTCRLWPFSNYGSGSFFGDLIVFNGAGAIKFRGDNSYFYKIENFNSSDLLEIENTIIGNRIGHDLELNPVGTGGIKISSSTITIDNTGGPKQLQIYGDFTLTIDAEITEIIASGASLRMFNSATVVMNGANNTYSGPTTISGGTLTLKGNIPDSDVTVEIGANLIIDGDVSLKSLTVDLGGMVTINPGKSLRIDNLNNNGSVTLNSNSITYASLITDTATGSGTVTYNRFVNANSNGNDLIAAPVSGQSWTDFLQSGTNADDIFNSGTNNPRYYAFGPFDNGAGNYVTWGDDINPPIDSGVGYRVATVTDEDTDPSNGIGRTLAFTGAIATNAITASVSISATDHPEWNLIGNPYPSYIDASDFLDYSLPENSFTNAELLKPLSGIYGYDGDAVAGVEWDIITLANANTPTNRLIAPGQGFFFPFGGTEVGSGTLESGVAFDPTMRTAGSSDDFIPGRSANSNESYYFMLMASTATKEFMTQFYFNENSSLGEDHGYDGALFTAPPSFALYSHLVDDNTGVPITLQSLHSSDISNTTIPLGVNANQGEQITFSIFESALPANVNVYLDDTEANSITLLNTGNYTLTPNVNLSGTGRFFLRFEDSALSVTDTSFDDINIFVNKTAKTVIINGQLNNSTVATLYDLQGRLVRHLEMNDSSRSQTIDVSNLSSGIYVVKLYSELQSKTQKVILD